jgi:hypothetical protein
MNYYYANAANEPVGPVTQEGLQALYKSGTITLDTYIAREGDSEWKTYRVIAETIRPSIQKQTVSAKKESGGKALESLKSLLVEGESLEAWSIQRRIHALTRRRMIIGVTSGRFIALTPKLLGGFDIVDLRWQDIQQGVFSANFTISSSGVSDLAGGSTTLRRLVCQGFQKKTAQHIYRLAQGHEQSWREKRRVRELEQMRASSGGVHISTPAGIPTNPPIAHHSEDPVERLKKAKEMLDANLITDSEFQAMKARIINSPS